jgi:hypothetical protein
MNASGLCGRIRAFARTTGKRPAASSQSRVDTFGYTPRDAKPQTKSESAACVVVTTPLVTRYEILFGRHGGFDEHQPP